MKTKKYIRIAVIVLLIIALFPIKQMLSDGGSAVYCSLLSLYEIKDWHQETPIFDGTELKGYKTLEGLSVEIFGVEVFNNVQ